MLSLEILSQSLLWIVVVIEGVVILALARQIGLLHERLGPTGARTMNVGPQIGKTVPPFSARDIHDHPVTLASERGKRTLLLFISTGCSDCAALIPHLKQLAASERDTLEVILIAFRTSPTAVEQYVQDHVIDSTLPLIVSEDLALRYQITLAPYGLMIDRSGVLRAKGLVNSYAHVESLLNAEELGVRSIQELLQRRDEMQPS